MNRLEIGPAFTGVYSGGAQEAGVAFADDFSEHVASRLTRRFSRALR